MRQVHRLNVILCAALIVLSMPVVLWAHGFAGKRFFPTTLTIDDPFVTDELSFEVFHIKEPGEGDESPTLSTEISGEFSKRITCAPQKLHPHSSGHRVS